MPKLSCGCGFVFDLSPIPGPNAYTLIPDDVLLKVWDVEESNSPRDADEPGLVGSLFNAGCEVLICPSCGRVLMRTEEETAYRVYRPEEP